MRFFSLVFLSFLVFILAEPVHAQSEVIAPPKKDNPITTKEVYQWQKRTPRRDQEYDLYIERLGKVNRDEYPSVIKGMRNLYAFTSYYEPFPDRLVDEMTRLAYTVQTSKDIKAVNNSLVEYKELLRKHLINMGVLNFAVTMARVDLKFGDPETYEEIREIIYQGMKSVADGSSPERAFQIVSRDEEVYILARMGVEIISSDVYQAGRGLYYNVYDITDKNGEFDQIFMDISKPVKVSYIKKYLAKKELTYTLPGVE